MASYYYLMASLPMLKAEGEMPFKYEKFLEMCQTSVSEENYRILENLTLSSKEGPLIDEWAKFYTAFSEELAFQRNTKLSRPATPPSYKDETLQRAISAAVKSGNPLAAEESLLSLQFEKLDLLIGMHAFDDCALMGYALKLKLLERKSVFNADNGKRELKRLINDLEEKVKSVR